MNDIIEITPGLECCLLCGRTLTNRVLHDGLEEPIINSIRVEHPEWASTNGACAPCVSAYRELLDGRLKRAARLDAERVEQGWRARISRFLMRGDVVGAESPRATTSSLEER